MTENTKLWDMLGRTDPAHTKAFTRGGGFRGTAIKPMWSYRRMTEEFGPCGEGWGVNAPSFQVVPGSDGEVLVYCTASVWYTFAAGERQRVVFGVGGDKVVNKFSSGLKSDDEAFKKAFTDAVTNALKLIGVGADVHMGMFDDNKYVNTMREEFADAPAEKPKRQVGINSSTGKVTAHAAKKDIDGPDGWNTFLREVGECENIHQLNKLAMAWSPIADTWPEPSAGMPSWRSIAKDELNKRREILMNGLPDGDEFPGDPNYRHPIMAG